jgi:hypothetical protein
MVRGNGISESRSLDLNYRVTDTTASQLTDADIAACTDVEELRAMWGRASTVQQEQITARANQLTGEVSE